MLTPKEFESLVEELVLVSMRGSSSFLSIREQVLDSYQEVWQSLEGNQEEDDDVTDEPDSVDGC